ncbi:zinc ribbon domain-containing protein [Candidatus Neomarinimicrobiota bacterium]
MRTIFASINIFVLMAVGIVSGQGSPFAKFDVYIYPEYDHPGLGIFVEIDTKPTEFPRYLEMDIPEQATIVLLYDRATGESNRLEIKRAEGRSFVGIDVAKQQVAVQYYYNPFEKDSTTRKVEYRMVTNEVLPEFHVTVQQPMGASNFKHSMEGAEVLDGDFGLKFYRSHNEGLQPGIPYVVSVSYNNPTGQLTVPQIQAKQEAGELPMNSQETQEPTSNLTLVLGIFLGLAIVIAFLVKYLGADDVKQVLTASSKATQAGQFCTNCGVPKRPNTKFCPNCGKEN